MDKIIYRNTDQYTMGISLKKEEFPEANNMALHVCEDENIIISNRKKLVQSLNYSMDQMICASQTHSDHFYKVTAKDHSKGALSNQSAIQNVDALYTYESNLMLTTFHADCVPILFHHNKKGVVGAIHSGWQGTIKEITYKLLTHLIEVEECEREGFTIHIGRAISQEMFEVDADVYQQFAQFDYAKPYMYFKNETNKYHINNQQIVKEQCLRAGILENQIEIDETCTFKDKNSFSYREDRQCGRHISFIIKK